MLRFRTAFDLDDEAERLRATWGAPQRVELIHVKAELLCELKKLASGQRCLRGHSPRRPSTACLKDPACVPLGHEAPRPRTASNLRSHNLATRARRREFARLTSAAMTQAPSTSHSRRM